MATKKPRILLTLDDELMKKIEDYRFAKRFDSKNAAIKHLIELGLKQEQK